MVQDMIAETWIELQQFRLQVLHASWLVDQVGGSAARTEIAGVKVATAKVYRETVMRTIQIYGSLGVSNEMPLGRMLLGAMSMGLADGPSEVHKIAIARAVLKQHRAVDGPWPSEHIPERRAAARARYADVLGTEA